MKKKTLLFWFIVLIALLPAAYLVIIWPSLPDDVVVHYGADMKPDRMGHKSELWIATGILTVVSVFVYLLLLNLHRFDPKRKGQPPSPTFRKLAVGLVVFMAALNIIIIASAKGTLAFQNLLFPLMGLMFAFIGNYMNNIKPNYFAGIRLPWTLSSDENWRKTHQLAGKLWFAGGLFIVLVSLLLPLTITLFVFIGVMAIIVLIPVIYSYRLFKHQS